MTRGSAIPSQTRQDPSDDEDESEDEDEEEQDEDENAQGDRTPDEGGQNGSGGDDHDIDDHSDPSIKSVRSLEDGEVNNAQPPRRIPKKQRINYVDHLDGDLDS